MDGTVRSINTDLGMWRPRTCIHLELNCNVSAIPSIANVLTSVVRHTRSSSDRCLTTQTPSQSDLEPSSVNCQKIDTRFLQPENPQHFCAPILIKNCAAHERNLEPTESRKRTTVVPGTASDRVQTVHICAQHHRTLQLSPIEGPPFTRLDSYLSQSRRSEH